MTYKTYWRGVALFAACSYLTLCIGCGGGSATPENAEAKSSGASSPSTDVAAGDAQPSAATVVQNGIGTEPAQCVAIFMDSLRKGDEQNANGVLTAKAREELAKTSYVIQPLGTPEGQFQIGRVGFPYEEKNVALVECIWTEPPVGNDPQTQMDIVCEVHQEPEGWRISGIGVTIPGTEETLVLDFEDAAALQATIDAATGQAQTPAQPPAAVMPEQLSGQLPPSNYGPPAGQVPTGQLPTGQVPATQLPTGQLPAGQVSAGQPASGLRSFPSLPNNSGAEGQSGQATGETTPAGQLAYPPQYGAPVNR